MARATITSASLTPNLANTVIDLAYTINFSPFDQITNLSYLAEVSVIGDDETDSTDDGVVPSVTGLPATVRVRSNGRDSVDKTFQLEVETIELNEDPWWNSHVNSNTDEELRLTVTMIPQLPQVNTAESDVITIDEIVV